MTIFENFEYKGKIEGLEIYRSNTEEKAVEGLPQFYVLLNGKLHSCFDLYKKMLDEFA